MTPLTRLRPDGSNKIMSERVISKTIALKDRLPPGQRWIASQIVYDIINVPDWDMGAYRFRVSGLVENPYEMTYEELKGRPRVEVLADFHCVTHWSVKGLLWEGVSARGIIEAARPAPEARYAFIRCLDGYGTNVPLGRLLEEDVLFALKLEGRELPKANGFPLRLVVPSLYAWKSAKYVREVELMDEDMPGYWEERGYHMLGDPWKEQRHRDKEAAGTGS